VVITTTGVPSWDWLVPRWTRTIACRHDGNKVELPALAAGSQAIDLVAKHRILEHQLASGPD
jgi:hypothetical protein